MAIQHRRGIFSKFDPSRMLPGEWAVVLSGDTGTSDGMAAYMCFAAGTVKRMATYDDLHSQIEDIESEITADLVNITETAAQEARDAATDVGNYGLRIGQLEDWAYNHDIHAEDIDELWDCCADVRADMIGFATILAGLTETWQFCFGTAVAPTSNKLSVSGSVATVTGTVSGSVLTLE